MVEFTYEEDKDQVFKDGPWFYGSTSLYMTPWHTIFVPSIKIPTSTPIWVRLHFLPPKYWNENALEFMGNALGCFIGVFDKTLEPSMYSYICIYVHMDLSTPLPTTLMLQVDDLECIVTLDYENLPFWCHQCHEYGHLFQNYPIIHAMESQNGHSSKAQCNPTHDPSKKPKSMPTLNASPYPKPLSNNKF